MTDKSPKTIEQLTDRSGVLSRLRCFFRMRRYASRTRRAQHAMQRMSRHLKLSAMQRQGLSELAQEFQELVSLARRGRRDAVDAVADAAMANPFDLAPAQSAVAENFDGLQRQINNTLARFGDWFATLDDVQRQQFRRILQRRLNIA